jgi:hypothetical protein
MVWVTMLIMADQDGDVESTIPGLAAQAGVSLEQAETAVIKFQSPDKYSRSQAHEGRRIAPIQGGWHILNHYEYTQKMSLEYRRERDRLRQQRYRATQKPDVPQEWDTGGTERDSHAMSQHVDPDVGPDVDPDVGPDVDPDPDPDVEINPNLENSPPSVCDKPIRITIKNIRGRKKERKWIRL